MNTPMNTPMNTSMNTSIGCEPHRRLPSDPPAPSWWGESAAWWSESAAARCEQLQRACGPPFGSPPPRDREGGASEGGAGEGGAGGRATDADARCWRLFALAALRRGLDWRAGEGVGGLCLTGRGGWALSPPPE